MILPAMYVWKRKMAQCASRELAEKWLKKKQKQKRKAGDIQNLFIQNEIIAFLRMFFPNSSFHSEHLFTALSYL